MLLWNFQAVGPAKVATAVAGRNTQFFAQVQTQHPHYLHPKIQGAMGFKWTFAFAKISPFNKIMVDARPKVEIQLALRMDMLWQAEQRKQE